MAFNLGTLDGYYYIGFPRIRTISISQQVQYQPKKYHYECFNLKSTTLVKKKEHPYENRAIRMISKEAPIIKTAPGKISKVAL